MIYSTADFPLRSDDRPYQVVEPVYPAPKWLKSFVHLENALNECKTLCQLKGRPFRVVRWGREGSGAGRGIPCRACGTKRWSPRFPKSFLTGYPDAHPVAEVHPNGRQIVYDQDGIPKVVGETNYAVSPTPFPRFEAPPLRRSYLDAVRAAQRLASQNKKRAYLVSNFGAEADRDPNLWTPVVYVEPGGLRRLHDDSTQGTVSVQTISPAHFQELIAQSRGASLLGHGA